MCPDNHNFGYPNPTIRTLWPSYELYSKLLVSPFITLITVPYIIPYITPFKEFRP